MAQWVKALQMNWNVSGSNPSRCSARFRDSPSLRCFWWPSSRNMNKWYDKHWVSDFICTFHLKNSKHIRQCHNGLVVSYWPFLLLITNSIKNEVKFSEDFLSSSFQIISFSKELRECKEFLDYISSYLPKLEYAQWLSTSTRDPNIPGFNPTDVKGWTLGTNLISRLSRLLLINIK